MPRGKNYVNNNQGVHLQAPSKLKASMKVCEYGSGCTRADCIYRHENLGKREEVCLPFLAGKCSFKDDGCRKRHPKKEEKARLIAKYKRTRCRFGDECYTDGCLYLHPREMKASEPNYIEPHHVAFPPLNGSSAPVVPKSVPNSAWKAAPTVPPPNNVQQPQQSQPFPQQAPQPVPQQHPAMSAPMMMNHGPPVWPPMESQMYPPYMMPPHYFDPSMQGFPMAYFPGPMPPHGVPPMMNFNAEAKEFIPGNSMA